ncbi:MAG: magnesium transporter [Vampirovibrionales bacterium]|nr:magnesium transporter [Vampirovibrionales bacterium]
MSSPPFTTELAERIRRLLPHKNTGSLKRLLSKHNFADIAETMETSLSQEETIQAFQYLNVGLAAQVLTSLSDELQTAVLASLPTEISGQMIRFMAVDDAVDILQELDPQHSKKILDELPLDSDTRKLHHLLLEEPDTAAGLMSTDYIDIHIDRNVGDAMALIKGAEEKDFIYYCYLVDDAKQLVGVVSLKTLILHDESAPLNRIANFDIKSLLTTYDQEFVANVFRKYYNLIAMPVVDHENILRGVITLDDIIDVIDEETSEELYQASGITLEEMDEKNLISGPVRNAVKARLPWLSITVVGQLLASFIIASQQKSVAQAVVAISFMPLLTGLTGNMGAQSATIAVRGLSQQLITKENFASKILRELRVAIITGLTFGSVVGTVTYLIYHHFELSALLFCWITISLCFSATAGIAVPYICEKYFNQDPASVGGPLITTVSDILTFSIYLYILKIFFDRMVLAG